MSPKEFLKFLSGAVELGDIKDLNSKNFEIVNNKVNNVQNDNTPEGIFCTWLKGFLEASETKELSPSQFSKISIKIFEIEKTNNLNFEVGNTPKISPHFPNSVNIRC